MRNDSQEQQTESHEDRRTIVVVGPCASGKTTLVKALRELGYDAFAVAQEHSIIRDLWRKRNPDVVIALDLDLSVVRERRSPTWSSEIYTAQHQRLQPAFSAANILIDTGEHDIDTALRMSLELLETAR
jgi:predicted ATPase